MPDELKKNPQTAEMLANTAAQTGQQMPQQSPPMPPQGNQPPIQDTPQGNANNGMNMHEQEAPVEPLGAQILRRIHKDHLALMEEYHEMLQHLEHENVRGFLEAALGNMDSILTATEDLFMNTYSGLSPLEGMEMPIGDTQREMEQPTPEEAVDGMELDRERQMMAGKSLKVKNKSMKVKQKHFFPPADPREWEQMLKQEKDPAKRELILNHMKIDEEDRKQYQTHVESQKKPMIKKLDKNKKGIYDQGQMCPGCGNQSDTCSCGGEVVEEEEIEVDEEGNPIEYEEEEYIDENGDGNVDEYVEDNGEINENDKKKVELPMEEQVVELDENDVGLIGDMIRLLDKMSGEDTTLEEPDRMEAFHIGKCMDKMHKKMKGMDTSSMNAVASGGDTEDEEELE